MRFRQVAGILVRGEKPREETVDAIAARLREDKFVPSAAKYYMWSDALDQIVDVTANDHWDYEV